MTDLAEPTDTGMHNASAHASTGGDPPELTSAQTYTASARHSRESKLSSPTKPTLLNISTSELFGSTSNLPAGADDLTPPTSAISSLGESQSLESLSQQKSSQTVGESSQDNGVKQQRLGSTSQSPPPEYSAGTKRTASGDVKKASVNGLGDVLEKSNVARHSHTSSTVSNGSKGNVLEVSLSC